MFYLVLINWHGIVSSEFYVVDLFNNIFNIKYHQDLKSISMKACPFNIYVRKTNICCILTVSMRYLYNIGKYGVFPIISNTSQMHEN